MQSFLSEQTTVDSLPPGVSASSLATLPSRENSPAICVSETGPQYYEPPSPLGGSGRGTSTESSPVHVRADHGAGHHRKGENVKKSLTTGISSLGNRFSNLGSKLKDKVNINRRDSELGECDLIGDAE